MISAFLIYEIKVAILVAIFSIIYFLLYRTDNSPSVKRIIIAGILVISMVLPLIHPVLNTATQNNWLLSNVFEKESGYEVTAAEADLGAILGRMILIGMILCATIKFIQHGKVIRLIRKEKDNLMSYGDVISVSEEIIPFSYFKSIVIPKTLLGEEKDIVLRHERAHIKLLHSYDNLLLDIVQSMQWFNPFIWILGKEMKLNHEYEVDRLLIDSGINSKNYKYLILKYGADHVNEDCTNTITKSQIEKRITRMKTATNNAASSAKSLLLIPVIIFCIACNSTDANLNYDVSNPRYKIFKSACDNHMKWNEDTYIYYLDASYGELRKEGVNRREYNAMKWHTRKANEILKSIITESYNASNDDDKYCGEINGVNIERAKAAIIVHGSKQ